MRDKRTEHLMATAQALVNAANYGLFSNGSPLPIYRAETIAGPRAGAVRLYAGLGTGPLFRALAADNAALARQFIGWRFPGEPAVYLDGQAVRIEAAWPSDLAQAVIRLQSVCKQPKGNGHWVLGVNEVGQTVIGGLTDETPSWLLAGTTGSGKTVALLSAGLQLSRDPSTRLVLIDGKEGAGLAALVNLRGVVGPLAADVETARNALAWVHAQMTARYRVIAAEGAVAATRFPHLAVIVDEFQEFMSDAAIKELLRRIVRRGRQARVHAILATQHPTLDSFGADSSIKRNLPGRVALKVLDAKASEVVVGAALPRADRLMGAGDAYAIGSSIHRTQLVLVDRSDFAQAERMPPEIEVWPEYDAADLGQEPTVNWAYSGGELAYALAIAHRGGGRPALERALERAGYGRPGVPRALRLLKIGREMLAALPYAGLALQEVEALPVVEGDGPDAGEIRDVVPRPVCLSGCQLYTVDGYEGK